MSHQEPEVPKGKSFTTQGIQMKYFRLKNGAQRV
jgi:hypothetical protein